MAPPADPPADIPALFAAERAALVALLRTVADDQWQQPTPCPEWTVLGLCHHLVGDDFGIVSRHRDRYLGTPAPDGISEGQFVAWLDDLQVEWVRAARRLSPRLAIDLLAWAGPQLVDTFGRQDPRARTAHVSWAGPHAVPVWLDQVRELSEYWIHRQQLLQALGRPADLRSEVVGPILDGLRWAYPYRLGALAAGEGTSATIEVSGPAAVTWHLVATAAGWTYAARPGRHPLAGMSLTTDQAWRLLSNNLSRDEQETLDLHGDQAITEVLRRTRAIIGSPN